MSKNWMFLADQLELKSQFLYILPVLLVDKPLEAQSFHLENGVRTGLCPVLRVQAWFEDKMRLYKRRNWDGVKGKCPGQVVPVESLPLSLFKMLIFCLPWIFALIFIFIRYCIKILFILIPSALLPLLEFCAQREYLICFTLVMTPKTNNYWTIIMGQALH